ncbi:hypothetical protein [Maribellus sediminis]|uniref:hypothetical protein n=1 Tax=Maribellus sediminis TaxID=2696285 RepID=UPI001430AF2E|nr:hypothetical protein [Maribellus sediminis]
MKTIALLFFLACSLSTFAQGDYQLNQAIDFFRTNKMVNGEIKNMISEKDIEGSPYLNPEFIKGDVYTSSKVKFVEIPLRYNIYNDEMQFQSPDGKVAAIAAPEIIEKVTFGDYTMEYIPFISAKKIRRGFFKLVVKGNATLYARPNIEYRQPVPPGAYKEPEPARFLEKTDSYYIRIGMDAAQKIESKSDLENVFPDHAKEVANFIKKNKVNQRKEDKLKALVEYYNSLQ